MHDMILKDIDKIIDAIYRLCGDYEKVEFVEDVQAGVRLAI